MIYVLIWTVLAVFVGVAARSLRFDGRWYLALSLLGGPFQALITLSVATQNSKHGPIEASHGGDADARLVWRVLPGAADDSLPVQVPPQEQERDRKHVTDVSQTETNPDTTNGIEVNVSTRSDHTHKAVWKCDKCGSDNDLEFIFCSQCGRRRR